MTSWHVFITVKPLPWSWSLNFWRCDWAVNVNLGPIQLELIHD